MNDRTGIFSGSDPFAVAREWLAAAEPLEPNDPNAIALATVDEDGLPNVRMVLLKEIEADAFLFYTNYGSAKGREIAHAGKAAFVDALEVAPQADPCKRRNQSRRGTEGG